ncbi:energy transducer TonB [Erythrobacter sp. HA6-11]
MAYADAKTLQQKSAGIAGAAIAHVAIGGLIVVGLTVTGTIPDIIDDGPIDVFDVKDPIPPVPPDTPPEPKPDTPPVQSDPFVPDPIIPISNNTPFELTIPDLPPPRPIEFVIPRPTPDPTPGLGAIQPIAAVPSNNPARWITDSDYKSRWIREGMTGSATFKLDISASGKVESCAITRSSGHAALDQATCSLIERRARFKPAKASDGSPTSGVYSSSIRWRIPD